jgi:predicted  nucleic acid-binding Zn-ribbon protein
MSTHATFETDTTLSITESGLTTLRLAVQTDAPTDHPVVVEAKLPATVDTTRVSVDPDAGDWTIYTDGTVHWHPDPDHTHDVAVGTLGVPVTDPDVVDTLAAVDLQVHDADAVRPAPADDPPPTVDPASLEATTPATRTPESVYERVHEYDTEPALDRDPGPEPTDTTEPGDDAETRPVQPTDTVDETAADDQSNGNDVVVAPAREPEATTEDDTDPEVAAPSDEEWAGDALENALRVRDDRERANENAYRFRLAFHAEDPTGCAIEVLEGLLNGTTVYGANPTLPDLRNGTDVDDLTVTVSSALDENDLVGALDDLGGVTVEAFEHVDVDGLPSETIDSNADEQFQLLDEAMDPAEYDEFAAAVDAMEAGGFDFSTEPVSFDDLVDDPEGASDIAARADDDTRASTEPDPETTSESESRVAERLLDELESGGVTERERVALRRRLGVDPRPSMEARIDHLHTRVEKFAAYTNALEAFLDENGTARDLLEELQGDVGTVYDRLDDAATERDTLDDRLDDAATERDTLDDRLDDATDYLDSLDDRVDERTTEFDERLDAVEADQDANQERIDGVADAVSTNRDDIDDLAADVHGDVDDLVDAIESLESTVESLDDRLDDVAETVEQNARVREKLESLAN